MPPPWLANMQRFGPPPSYPTLRIPGVNAPIPSGAAYGLHAGGWGKPPVDEYGQPLYGDVFGVYSGKEMPEEQVDKSYRWGAIVAGESSDEDEGDDDVEEEQQQQGGMETPATADGISSMISGLETPDTIDLRKRMGTDTPESQAPRELYQVVQQKQSSMAGQLFGSDKTYVIPTVGGSADDSDQLVEDDQDKEVGEKRKKGGKTEAVSNASKKLKEFKF
jgi:splicing factor 3B subunit 2